MFDWFFGKSKETAPRRRWNFGNVPPNRRIQYINTKTKNDGEEIANATYKRIRKALSDIPLKFWFCTGDKTFIYHSGDRKWKLDPDGTVFVDTLMSAKLTEDEALDAVLYFMKHCATAHCNAELKAKRLAASASR